jgi:hypothetical protein
VRFRTYARAHAAKKGIAIERCVYRAYGARKTIVRDFRNLGRLRLGECGIDGHHADSCVCPRLRSHADPMNIRSDGVLTKLH